MNSITNGSMATWDKIYHSNQMNGMDTNHVVTEEVFLEQRLMVEVLIMPVTMSNEDIDDLTSP